MEVVHHGFAPAPTNSANPSLLSLNISTLHRSHSLSFTSPQTRISHSPRHVRPRTTKSRTGGLSQRRFPHPPPLNPFRAVSAAPLPPGPLRPPPANRNDHASVFLLGAHRPVRGGCVGVDVPPKSGVSQWSPDDRGAKSREQVERERAGCGACHPESGS